MAYTYPAPAPTITGDYLTIHRLLQTPALIARRLREISEQRFISDALLTARLPAFGGAVWYEQGESMYTDRSPEIVGAGGEYPLTGLGIGATQIAEIQNWGLDAPVTDKAIKRLLRNPVDRAFTKLINQMVRTIDGVALAVIASSVTQTVAAAATWNTATAKQMLLDVSVAKADVIDLGEGFEPDTVVLPSLAWAYAMAAFVDAGFLPRESSADNPALTGEFPTIDGMRWLPTPAANIPVQKAAMVVDSTQLGGMADEELGGPGYAGVLSGIETKSIRDDLKDRYILRARRVTVPVVLEPNAAKKITGVLP